MGDITAHGEVKEATIEATVIRRDGTVEHLGVIAEYKRPEVNEDDTATQKEED